MKFSNDNLMIRIANNDTHVVRGVEHGDMSPKYGKLSGFCKECGLCISDHLDWDGCPKCGASTDTLSPDAPEGKNILDARN